MSDIDPKFLEFLKKTSPDPRREPRQLVKRTEWSYGYKCGEDIVCNVSRFLAEEGFEVSAADVRKRWSGWDQRERMGFAFNWCAKRTWNSNDIEILELIMAEGNDHIWQSCSQAFLKHPDRDRAIAFLIDRLSHHNLDHQPLNYIQVLGMSKDQRAAEAIRPYFEKYRKGLELEGTTGVPEDVVFGPIPYHAYFAAAGALFETCGCSEYEEAIRMYFDHPSEQVRWWAEHALGVEGPTTAKRNAEYRARREPD